MPSHGMDRLIDARKARDDGYVGIMALTLENGQGERYQREVVTFGHSACVLPYDPDRKVAMVIRLTRAPLVLAGVTEPLVEVPAGMIDAGESPAQAAIREAMEEVGIALASVESVAVTWPSPGVVGEQSHMFLAPYGVADRHGAGGGLAQEHEGIVCEEVALGDLWRMVEAGELRDMKTLALVLSLRVRRPELF